MYPKRYLDYLHYFHVDRDYFECHEVLEEEWKNAPKTNKNSYWVTLIQIAVALYHERRGNYKGASILYKRLLVRIQDDSTELHNLGLDAKQLLGDIELRLNNIGKQFFSDYNLPLTDEYLIRLCRTRAGERWLAPSNLNNAYLVDKHRLRNRSH
ncbi:DUF309 domain-containing protein [Bacillus sp. JCM 19041]|uniref:DUF309 domain-containing protein n=1 Tax=Bacillus sp. JCM 19041 TaxID=1460637 RepID=UPI0006CFBB15